MQDAKQRFSELVQRALEDGPQVVTRHGKEAVVVLAVDEYRRLVGTEPRPDFKAYLISSPDFELLELDSIVRDTPRFVDL